MLRCPPSLSSSRQCAVVVPRLRRLLLLFLPRLEVLGVFAAVPCGCRPRFGRFLCCGHALTALLLFLGTGLLFRWSFWWSTTPTRVFLSTDELVERLQATLGGGRRQFRLCVMNGTLSRLRLATGVTVAGSGLSRCLFPSEKEKCWPASLRSVLSAWWRGQTNGQVQSQRAILFDHWDMRYNMRTGVSDGVVAPFSHAFWCPPHCRLMRAHVGGADCQYGCPLLVIDGFCVCFWRFSLPQLFWRCWFWSWCVSHGQHDAGKTTSPQARSSWTGLFVLWFVFPQVSKRSMSSCHRRNWQDILDEVVDGLVCFLLWHDITFQVSTDGRTVRCSPLWTLMTRRCTMLLLVFPNPRSAAVFVIVPFRWE